MGTVSCVKNYIVLCSYVQSSKNLTTWQYNMHFDILVHKD